MRFAYQKRHWPLFVYLISGSLPLPALIHLRQFSLVLQLNKLGSNHSSFAHATQWAERAPPCWLGLIDIVTPHMIPFWNPWDHRSYLGIVCTIFGHPQNDQEGQKYLLKRVLEDFGCIDADYDIIAPYMIHF